MAFWVHIIWPFWHFFPFCPDSSSKILSKIKFTVVYRPFFPKKWPEFGHFFHFTLYWWLHKIWPFWHFFQSFFALIRHLKSTVLLLFGKMGGSVFFSRENQNCPWKPFFVCSFLRFFSRVEIRFHAHFFEHFHG